MDVNYIYEGNGSQHNLILSQRAYNKDYLVYKASGKNYDELIHIHKINGIFSAIGYFFRQFSSRWVKVELFEAQKNSPELKYYDSKEKTHKISVLLDRRHFRKNNNVTNIGNIFAKELKV